MKVFLYHLQDTSLNPLKVGGEGYFQYATIPLLHGLWVSNSFNFPRKTTPF